MLGALPLRVPVSARSESFGASLGRKAADGAPVQFSINRINTASAACNASRDRVIHVSRRPSRVISGLAKPFIATVAQPLRSPPHRMLGSAPR